MDFTLSEDETAILDALEGLAKPYAAIPAECASFHLFSEALDAALAESGFLDVGAEPELGMAAAVEVVDRLARLPFCAEVAASAIVRPLVAPEIPRPLCLIDASAAARPVRFAAQAASAIVLDGDEVHAVSLGKGAAQAVETLFAYPMGRLAGEISGAGEPLSVSAGEMRRAWRLALAAELGGLMQAALDSAVRHVTEREQFGHPIGTFQAVRHRLAEAGVKIAGVRLLARKAAATGSGADAALAAFQAQDCAPRIVYDLHQFHGAMGVTLEHPLHLWTYRIKALLSELGGRQGQTASADDLWPGQAPAGGQAANREP